MPQLDIRSDLLSNVTLTHAVIANGATAGSIIDTFNFDLGLMFEFVTTAYTDGTYVFSIEEGDDPALSGSNLVTAAQIIGNLGDVDPSVAAVNGDKVPTIGIFSTKRYVRVTVTATGVTTGATVLVLVVQKSADMPVDPIDES